MLYKNKCQCDFCDSEFNDIRDLAVHRLDHLVITVPFLQICPFCDKQSMILAELLEHILDHIMIDKLQQAQLVNWLGLQFHKNQTSRSSIKPDGSADFYILPPPISFKLKCLYCDNLYPEGRLVEHVFGHFSCITSSQKRTHLKLWFKNFFDSEDSHSIVSSYYDFIDKSRKLDSDSNLLEKLPLFENEKSNTCRFCGIMLDNAALLYQHYVDWHNHLEPKAWNCPICNYKELDSEKFVEHVYKKHMACILCRKKNQSFDESLKHAKKCLKGCPYCHQKLKFEHLLNHLNANFVNLICPFCREQSPETDHLKEHMRECNSRPPMTVFCPLCKKIQFDEENKLRDHLKQCKPWIPVVFDGKMPCSDVAKETSYVTETNSIKFSDIKGHVSQKIADMITSYFS